MTGGGVRGYRTVDTSLGYTYPIAIIFKMSNLQMDNITQFEVFVLISHYQIPAEFTKGVIFAPFVNSTGI